MTDYRRTRIGGASYFFTVNLLNRRSRPLLDHLDLVKTVMGKVLANHPYRIDASAVLPDHMHCIWTLPEGDADYATRWMLIKSGISRRIPRTEEVSFSRSKRRERGIWQRRYWEHLVRDDADMRNHIDYIHWNPVKHGWVDRVRDWPYSSFHRFVECGIYPLDWGDAPVSNIETGERQKNRRMC